jgi:hypothetical protein
MEWYLSNQTQFQYTYEELLIGLQIGSTTSCSFKLHALAALPMEKQHAVPIIQEVELAPEPIWTLRS